MISIIIPYKNEPYIKQTVLDVDENAVGDIEILIGDDGEESIGQRAMMNKLARQAKGDYIMKLDAHCSMGPGFDKILMEDMRDNWIVAPYLMALNPETWKIRQDKTMASFVFDTNMVMQHSFNNQELLQETMCLQGSCFLVSAENYWNWNLCDEELGSWGGQGVELGIKAYLNGGACYTNKNTYYGHWFRTEEEAFPYKRDMAEIQKSQAKVIEKLRTKEIAPLIRKWNYPCDWTEDFVNGLT